MALLPILIRFVLGAVFIYSGFSKLIVPAAQFEVVIEGYQFLNPAWIKPIALSLPWAELVIGMFVFTGFLTRISTVCLGAFSAIFIFLLSRSLMLKLPITECGCFGVGISLAPYQALILDSGLFLMALGFILFPSKRLSLDERLQK